MSAEASPPRSPLDTLRRLRDVFDYEPIKAFLTEQERVAFGKMLGLEFPRDPQAQFILVSVLRVEAERLLKVI